MYGAEDVLLTFVVCFIRERNLSTAPSLNLPSLKTLRRCTNFISRRFLRRNARFPIPSPTTTSHPVYRASFPRRFSRSLASHSKGLSMSFERRDWILLDRTLGIRWFEYRAWNRRRFERRRQEGGRIKDVEQRRQRVAARGQSGWINSAQNKEREEFCLSS